jgi:hypothetical protein
VLNTRIHYRDHTWEGGFPDRRRPCDGDGGLVVELLAPPHGGCVDYTTAMGATPVSLSFCVVSLMITIHLPLKLTESNHTIEI